MSQPHVYLLRMGVFLVAVVAAGIALRASLAEVFVANQIFNGLILGVGVVGVLYTIGRVIRLAPEIAWVNSFRRGEPGLVMPRRPRLLAPMAMLLGDRGGPLTLSAAGTRSILDSVGSRLDESRDLTRYFTGLLVFLGLLGTFWGLLQTVSAVGETIRSLAPDAGAESNVFATLLAGLEAPLTGMGTAFSSSLFGLAGSLVLGFLDLQAAQAQNRFYNDLEEWLSAVTRIGTGAGSSFSDEDQTTPAYVSALLERMGEGLERLQRAIVRAEDNRANADTHMMELAGRIGSLTDALRGEQARFDGIVRQQNDLRQTLEALVAALGRIEGATGAGVETHLRSLDTNVKRLAEEAAHGRDQAVSDLRFELKLLRKAILAQTSEAESLRHEAGTEEVR
ncbi:MAG: flagellar motor protein MotA [Alphaproteobacteria bacterium]|nr:flagellar motor protein MotA [Alphaproteobacteria bacterium]